MHAGTIQGRVELASQHFCAHMRTAILAELARTNMESALDHDNWT